MMTKRRSAQISSANKQTIIHVGVTLESVLVMKKKLIRKGLNDINNQKENSQVQLAVTRSIDIDNEKIV